MISVRELRADETGAFDELREWLDHVRPEMSEPQRRRLRAFFQDHPVNELRVAEDVETC